MMDVNMVQWSYMVCMFLESGHSEYFNGDHIVTLTPVMWDALGGGIGAFFYYY